MKKRKLIAGAALLIAGITAVTFAGCTLGPSEADDSTPSSVAVSDGTASSREEFLASQETPSTYERRLYEEALIAGPAATQTMGQRISEGFRSNLSGVLVFLENSAVWLLSSLPVLLLLALVVLLILLIIRTLRKRRGDRPPRGKKNKGGPAFWTPQPPAAQAQEAQGKHKEDAHETK